MRALLFALAAAAAAPLPRLAPELDLPEKIPPSVEHYAAVDAEWRRAWGTDDRGRPNEARHKLPPVEALKWQQFKQAHCHNSAHGLGRAIFDGFAASNRTRDDQLDEALGVCGYRCTGGCLHGAVNAYATAGRKADVAYAPDIPKLCAKPAMRAIVGLGECAHAVGHALALLAEDDAALDVLTSSDKEKDDIALDECAAGHVDASVAHYCSGGVVMERGSAFFGKDKEKRCAEVRPSARAACYYFALRNAAHGYSDRVKAVRNRVEESCPKSGAPGRAACVYGAATALVMHSMRDAAGADGAAFCESLEAAARPACVDGLMFRTGKFGTPAMQRATCAAFKNDDLAALCRDVAAAGMYSLRKGALLAEYAAS